MDHLRSWLVLLAGLALLGTPSACNSDERSEPGEAGSGGVAAGAAGEAGEGGRAGADARTDCPDSIATLEGESCADYAEGFECSDGGTNPCEFGNAVVCVSGVWERRESYPAPCGGASGSGGSG